MEAIISAVVLPIPETPPVITAALPSRSMFNLQSPAHVHEQCAVGKDNRRSYRNSRRYAMHTCLGTSNAKNTLTEGFERAYAKYSLRDAPKSKVRCGKL